MTVGAGTKTERKETRSQSQGKNQGATKRNEKIPKIKREDKKGDKKIIKEVKGLLNDAMLNLMKPSIGNNSIQLHIQWASVYEGFTCSSLGRHCMEPQEACASSPRHGERRGLKAS